MKLGLFGQIFEKKKNLNIKFHENSSSGNHVVPCRRTDRQTDRETGRRDEANSRFRNFANAPMNQ